MQRINVRGASSVGVAWGLKGLAEELAFELGFELSAG